MHAERLADKHRPQRLDDIFGQGAITLRIADFLAAPRSAALLFSGPPGVGKTSLGIVIANELGCHPTTNHWDYDGAKFDADDMDFLERSLRYAPLDGGWRVIRIEEADWLCRCPKLAARWKTLLDHLPVRTVFSFTTNYPEKFTDAFLRRVEHLKFESDCEALALDAQALAARIWYAETGRWEDCPSVADLGICVNGAIQFSAVPMGLESRLRPATPFRLSPPVESPRSLFQAAVENARPVPAPVAVPSPDPVVIGPSLPEFRVSSHGEKCDGFIRDIHVPGPRRESKFLRPPLNCDDVPPSPRSMTASEKAAKLRDIARYLVCCETCPTRDFIEARFDIPWHVARTTVLRRFPRGPQPSRVVPIPPPVQRPDFDWSELAELTLSASV